MHSIPILGICFVLLVSLSLALPFTKPETPENAANCAMCHGFAGRTGTRRWSTSLEVRTPQNRLPITDPYHNQLIEKRGTNWDNSPGEDDAALERRGTAWDNAIGTDKGTSLGPKVETSGGKPQPLYGNAWEQGRFRRRAFSHTMGTDTALIKKSAEPEDAKSVNGGQSSFLVPTFYPSGSWKRHGDGASIEHRDVTVDAERRPTGGRYRLFGSCPDCMMRRWIRRWLSAPYVSSPGQDLSDSWFTPNGEKPTTTSRKLRERRTEDSKGGVAPERGTPLVDGGVPMPL